MREKSIDMTEFDTIRALLDTLRDDMAATLARLVEIPSVKGEAAEGALCGQSVRAALEEAIAIAEEFGFVGHIDPDGRYAYADFGEIKAGAPYLCIMTHLDVVPAEPSGWLKGQPFTMTREGDFLYGRGTADDKGGAVSALYALRALALRGTPCACPVRLFFGGDEESGMTDVSAFLSHLDGHLPALTLVPDGEFPLSVGEKSIARLRLHTPKIKTLLSAEGGVAPNVVAPHALFVFAYDERLLTELEDKVRGREGYSLSYTGERISLSTLGIAAHASAPDGSRNAVRMALSLLATCRALPDSDRAVFYAAANFIADDYGTALGIAGQDAHFGKTTAVCGLLSCEDGRLALDLDLRFGTSHHFDTLLKNAAVTVGSAGIGYCLETLDYDQGFCLGEDTAPAALFLSIYRAASGDENTRPFFMGGGTYARHMPNAYSVGTCAPYRSEKQHLPEGHGGIHGDDECISLSGLSEATALFTLFLSRFVP